MAHGHDILNMMNGNTYHSKEELVKAITDKFGSAETFHTCSVEGFSATEIVDFLEKKGKFMPTADGGFTVNMDKMCHH